MIPRIFHRIWLDDPMPQEFADYGARWAELHPQWEVRDWRSRADLPRLANQETFDRARELCPRDWKRFESDLLRLELLQRYGGIYIDTDVEPLLPIDPLLQDVEAFASWSPNRGRGGRRLLTQSVIGAVPGHPWIRACIAGIPEAVRRYAGRPLAQMVGPHHVTRIWEQHPEGVTIFTEDVFGPQANRDRDRGRPVDLAGAYAWHRWANTRDNRRGGVAT